MTTLEAIHFRPTKKYWQSRIVEFTPIVILGILVLLFLKHIGMLNNILASLFMLFSFTVSIIGLLFLIWIRTRAEIVLDQTYIKGNTGLETFQFTWDDIIAIHKETSIDRHNTEAVLIITHDDVVIMELKGFDQTAVWQAIDQYAPSITLEPDAYKKSDQYQNNKQKLQDKLPLNLKASIDARLVYIVVSSFLLVVTYLLFPISPIMSVISTIIFLLVIFETLLLFSKLTIDDEAITSWKLWKKHKIAWTDVELVEKYGNGHSIAFHTKQNRLIVPTRMWPNKQKEDFNFLCTLQIEARKIEVKNSHKLIYPQI